MKEGGTLDDDIKTLKFNWDYGVEELALKVMSYADGNGIYIGLISKEEDESWEWFDDLTVNLPGYSLEPDEAFISDMCNSNKLEFIKTHKLGKVLAATGASGVTEFKLAAFDLERLAEFDKEGVMEYRQLREIDTERTLNALKEKIR